MRRESSGLLTFRSLTFNQGDELIRQDIFKEIPAPTYPRHLYVIDALVPAQAKMEAFAVVALIASTAVDLIDQFQVSCLHKDTGTYSAAIGFSTLQLDLEPVPGFG